jgi:hypothetical protein
MDAINHRTYLYPAPFKSFFTGIIKLFPVILESLIGFAGLANFCAARSQDTGGDKPIVT